MEDKGSYENRFPIGIQTVVEDRLIGGSMTYQVNTRIPGGSWWISKTTPNMFIKRELLQQAKRLRYEHQLEVNTKYVRRYL